MSPIERLTAIEEIKQLKARYFRALDARDMPAYAGVFTDDARIDVRGSVSEDEGGESTIGGFDEDALIVGGQAMADFVVRHASGIRTAHHGHMPEIEVLSDSEARGIWAFEDHLWFPDGPHRMLHGYGHYHETYARVDGAWRIASMRITRIKVEMS